MEMLKTLALRQQTKYGGAMFLLKTAPTSIRRVQLARLQRQCGIAAGARSTDGGLQGIGASPGSGVAAMGFTPITLLHLETESGLTAMWVEAFWASAHPT